MDRYLGGRGTGEARLPIDNSQHTGNSREKPTIGLPTITRDGYYVAAALLVNMFVLSIHKTHKYVVTRMSNIPNGDYES